MRNKNNDTEQCYKFESKDLEVSSKIKYWNT